MVLPQFFKHVSVAETFPEKIFLGFLFLKRFWKTAVYTLPQTSFAHVTHVYSICQWQRSKMKNMRHFGQQLPVIYVANGCRKFRLFESKSDTCKHGNWIFNTLEIEKMAAITWKTLASGTCTRPEATVFHVIAPSFRYLEYMWGLGHNGTSPLSFQYPLEISW